MVLPSLAYVSAAQSSQVPTTLRVAPLMRAVLSNCLPLQIILGRQSVASLTLYVLAAHALQVPATVRDASPTARVPPAAKLPQTVLTRQFVASLAAYY